MNRLKRGYAKFTEIINQVSDHHVGAYAAQTAYFFMLCMIPIILLLLTRSFFYLLFQCIPHICYCILIL